MILCINILTTFIYFICFNFDGCTTYISATTLTANSTRQILTSPNYPKSYGSSMKVTWTIVADSSITNGVIQIKVLDSSMEPSTACYFDSVDILNGPKSYSPSLDSWCGSSYPKTTLQSKTNTVQIIFKTNSYRNDYKGFRLQYWAIPTPYLLTGTVTFTWIHFALFGFSGGIAFILIVTLMGIAILRKRNAKYIHFEMQDEETQICSTD